MRSLWSGTRLVAGRSIGEGWQSRSWRAVTIVMFLFGVAAVFLPRLFGSDTTSYTLAVTPDSSTAIPQYLSAAGEQQDFTVELIDVPDAAGAEQSVRDGDADVAISGSGPDTTLYVTADGAGTFPALVTQAATAQATQEAMSDAGLTQQQIEAILSTPPPTQVEVGRSADPARAGLGFAVGVVLYLAIILTGTSIATGVAVEKSTRISEVLLAVLKPPQLLVGTVLGVGLLGLAQVSALGLPVMVGLAAAGSGVDLPAQAPWDIVFAILWFVLGLSLYAFIFAALATLVEKVTEVGPAILPANALLIGSYMFAIIVTTSSPNSAASVFASMFPLSAPMVMPVRWASGLVPGWQLALSMVLTAAGAVLIAMFASRVYARGLARTGRRVKLSEVLRDG